MGQCILPVRLSVRVRGDAERHRYTLSAHQTGSAISAVLALKRTFADTPNRRLTQTYTAIFSDLPGPAPGRGIALGTGMRIFAVLFILAGAGCDVSVAEQGA